MPFQPPARATCLRLGRVALVGELKGLRRRQLGAQGGLVRVAVQVGQIAIVHKLRQSVQGKSRQVKLNGSSGWRLVGDQSHKVAGSDQA